MAQVVREKKSPRGISAIHTIHILESNTHDSYTEIDFPKHTYLHIPVREILALARRKLRAIYTLPPTPHATSPPSDTRENGPHQPEAPVFSYNGVIRAHTYVPIIQNNNAIYRTHSVHPYHHSFSLSQLSFKTQCNCTITKPTGSK